MHIGEPSKLSVEFVQKYVNANVSREIALKQKSKNGY